MQLMDYKKYLLFVFIFLCCGVVTAQPGWAGEIYLKNLNRERLEVVAYTFNNSDSINFIKTLYTKETKEAVAELIPIKVVKYTYDATVGVRYISEAGSLCNKLLIEIYDKQNTNLRMKILVVGDFKYSLPLIEVNIPFAEGLFLLEIPAKDYDSTMADSCSGIWNLTLALKKLY